MSSTDTDFVVIGENIHATRVLMRKNARIVLDDEGAEAISFVEETGESRFLRIPEEEKLTQPYCDGRVKHVKVAVQVAMDGREPDRSVALSYLSMLAQRQVNSGAKFLDVNIDELSNDLDEQVRAMRFLVGVLTPLVTVPLSIDSSGLEIIRAGLETAVQVGGSRLGPPMLNSASLEQIGVLELAAELESPVVVTAAGEQGLPQDAEQRVTNAGRMIEAALAAGIKPERVFVDPLVFPIAVDSESGLACLDAISEIRRVHGEEIHITGGMSNVSFGLPSRRLLNDAFLVLAVDAGADSGIVDPTTLNIEQVLGIDRSSRPFQLAVDVLTGVDSTCRAYVKAYRAGELTTPTP